MIFHHSLRAKKQAYWQQYRATYLWGSWCSILWAHWKHFSSSSEPRGLPSMRGSFTHKNIQWWQKNVADFKEEFIYYFISGIKNQCKEGRKLVVVVLATASPSVSPFAAPPPKTPSASSSAIAHAPTTTPPPTKVPAHEPTTSPLCSCLFMGISISKQEVHAICYARMILHECWNLI